MKKQIWHLKVGYKWRNIRMVRGVEKPTKEFKKGTFVTCSVGDNVEELDNSGYLKTCIANNIKSSTKVEIIITDIIWRNEAGISNDVY